MNTKQKLTLGIAAIFMVTLTIVGVTYAYFVTRVEGTVTENVNVQTATLGDIQYVDSGETDISLVDALPGAEALTKHFGVTNAGEAGSPAGTYALALIVSTGGTGTWIHSVDTTEATLNKDCYGNATNDYDSDADMALAPTACTAGKVYDNIYVTVYETDSMTGTKGDVVVAKQRLQVGADVVLKTNIEISPAADAATNNHYYILEVEYADAGMNQNLENEATITIKPTIVK